MITAHGQSAPRQSRCAGNVGRVLSGEVGHKTNVVLPNRDCACQWRGAMLATKNSHLLKPNSYLAMTTMIIQFPREFVFW